MDGESVADTLQIVRDRRLHRKSHHQRSLNEISYNESKSKALSSNEAVALSIARGRAILADAEAHLSLFNEFVHHQNDSKITHSCPLHEAEANAFEANLSTKDVKSLISPPLDAPSMVQRVSSLSSAEYIEARVMSGDPIVHAEPRPSFKDNPGYDDLKLLKFRQLKRFDPSQLNVTRRASQSDTVRKIYIPSNRNDKNSYRFKALPLPNGKEVKSDIFAQTKAVRGKMTQKLDEPSEPETEANQKKKCHQSNDQRYIDRFTPKELSMIQNLAGKDEIESDISLNESSSLRRDITRLELLLGRAKDIVARKRGILDSYKYDIEEESLNAYVHYDQDIESLCISSTYPSNYTSKPSLYERQQKWLRARRKKQSLARQKFDEAAMDGVTGKPELDIAKTSWAKAKEEHALSSIQFKQQEQRRMEEKGLMVKCIDMINSENEVESLLEEENICSGKKRLSSKELQDSLTKLSQPRKADKKTEVEIPDTLVNEVTVAHKSEPHSTLSKKTFSELSDVQFSEMMRSLGIGKVSRKNNRNCTEFEREKRDGSSDKENTIFKCYASSPNQIRVRPKPEIKVSFESKSLDTHKQKYHPRILSPSTKQSDFREGAIANACSAITAAEIALSGESDQRLDPDASFPIMLDVPEVMDETVQPYHRYEAGKVPFFDRSSSSERGRFRVRDARDYAPESMRRVPDIEEGVMLLVGKKKCAMDEAENGDTSEVVITIVFERSLFNEHSASVWWRLHRQRFIDHD